MAGEVKNEFWKAKAQIDGVSVTYPATTIGGTYTQAQVQALSTALTNLIATLRAQGLIV